MNIDEILNMIDDMLEEAWSLPFSGGRCVVDAQKVKECVEDIRLNLPGEIKQAKMIVADRNDIIKGAERQAESTLRKAVTYGKLKENIDVKKFGKQWIITQKAMEREYGPMPSEDKK